MEEGGFYILILNILLRYSFGNLSNQDNQFGIKSIGSIDFSSYEASSTQNTATLQVNNISISDEFEAFNVVNPDGSISYIWDNLILAVNNNPSEYNAFLATYSDPNPSSNLKIIIILS